MKSKNNQGWKHEWDGVLLLFTSGDVNENLFTFIVYIFTGLYDKNIKVLSILVLFPVYAIKKREEKTIMSTF